MMTFKEALIISSGAAFIGVLLGLVVRLKRESVDNKYLLKTFILSVKYLIIYPITLPYLILRYKEDVADIFTKKHMCNAPKKNRDKFERKLKRDIIRQLTIKTAVHMWFDLFDHMYREYDGFVFEQIKLAKKYVERKYSVESESSINKECDSNIIRVDFSNKRKVRVSDVFIANQLVFDKDLRKFAGE